MSRAGRFASVLVVGSLVAASCSSAESTDSVEETPTTTVSDVPAETTTDEPASTSVSEGGATDSTAPDTTSTAQPRSAIAFTSGSAFSGSLTSFRLDNTDTGESRVVSVMGNDEGEPTEVDVAPGTYTVTPLGPSVAGSNVSLVEQSAPQAITVAEPTTDEPEQMAEFDFELDTLSNPLRMRIESLTATTVDLAWDASGLDVADIDATVSFVVRRTDGSVAAADRDDGDPVDLLLPTANRAEAIGLDPEREYTFTVFAEFERDGEVADWSAALTATTAGLGSQSVAYALAPNTVVPTSFDDLQAERIDERSVRITLADDNWSRQSLSELPLIGSEAMADRCLVGSPILVGTDIAGDDAFYGLIESCGGEGPVGLRQAPGSDSVVVNTSVPLAAVFSYLDLDGSIDSGCYDLESTEPLSPEQCQQGADADGDGLDDASEVRLGTDPDGVDSDGDSIDDFTEVEVLGTDPLNTDSDFDSLPDTEGDLYGTDPLVADSDDDGCWDTGELDAGRDPLDAGDADGECVVPAGTPRWESSVDRTRDVVRAGGPVTVPESLDLADPDGLATGDVQVTVLWASGDDLDLVVTEPNGAQVSDVADPASTVGVVDVTDPGGECGGEAPRAENATWTGPTDGLYFVDVVRRTTCDGPALAQVRVTVDGSVVVDQVVAVGIDGPVTFGVGEEAVVALQSDPAPEPEPEPAPTTVPEPAPTTVPGSVPDEPVDVGDLEPPADLGTGEIQVTLLWASGDDLDVFVTEPTGDEISYVTTTSAAGGFLDADDLGGDCTVPVERAENVFWDTAPPDGTYTVRVVNSSSCDGPTAVTAQVQVRIGGELVVDQTVQPDVGEPITFDYPPPGEASGLRMAAQEVPDSTTALRALRAQTPILRAPKVVCEAEGSAVFGLQQTFTPRASVDLSLSTTSMSLTVEAGAELSINPLIELEGKVECEIEDLPKLEFPALKTSPIPVVVSVEPSVKGSASAKVTLSGPGVKVYAGVKGSAGVSLYQKTCSEQRSRQVQRSYEVSVKGFWSWFTDTVTKWVTEIYYAVVPCGIGVNPWVSAAPVQTFGSTPFTASMEGELGVDLGLTVTLAFGKDATIARATAGLEGTVAPVSAKLEGKLSTEGSCLELSFGLSIELSLKLEAFVDIGVKEFGAEKEIPIYDDRFQYPGAVLGIGECPDDD